MLKKRLTTSVILIGIFILCYYFNLIPALASLAIILAGIEFSRFSIPYRSVSSTYSDLLLIILPGLSWFFFSSPMSGLVLGLLLIFILSLFEYESEIDTPQLEALYAPRIFILVYIGFLGAISVSMINKLLTTDSMLAGIGGRDLFFLIISVIICSDSGGYLFGKFFGKKKVFPRTSPGKTLEGYLGSFITSAFFLAIYYQLFFSTKVVFSFSTIFILFLFVITIVFTSALGDVIESAIKRRYSIKDSGNLLPGHGGVFDRIDSYLLTFPVVGIFLEIWISSSQ